MKQGRLSKNSKLISTELLDSIVPVLKQHSVLRASIFGSFARGEETPESDIDILIELPRGKTFFDLGGLYMDLKDSLKRNVDLCEYTCIHPRLKSQIMQEQILIYEKAA